MKFKIVLIVIILLGAFLRFFELQYNPPGFYSDEASYAYNAYSILKTGQDEYGRQYPNVFEAFGDYKLPVMLYSIVASFAAFGASEWSARFPGALYGTLTIISVYLLVRQILKFNNSDDSNQKMYTTYLPLLTSLIVAIAPSHVFVSRGTWELTPALFFITAASFSLLKTIEALKINPKLAFRSTVWLILSIIFFASSMYAYNSARVFVPLFLISLLIIFKNQAISLFKHNKLVSLFSVIITLVLLLPLLTTLTSPQVTQRAKYISVFYDKGVESRLFDSIRADGGQPVQITRILHNKPLFYFLDISARYLSHFDPNFLFTIGDTFQIFQIVGVGFLPLLTLPFLYIGIYYLFKNRPHWLWVMLSWLLISPIASAFTTYTPSTSRSMNMLIPLAIFSSYGIIQSYLFIKSRQSFVISALFTPIFVALIIINTAYIFNRYFIETPKFVAEKWNDGYEETVDYISKIEKNYDRIVVSSSQAPSYIFYLWNLRYDPAKYHSEAKVNHTPDAHGLNFTSQFGKYYFTKNISEEIKKKSATERVLYVAFPDELEDYTRIIYSRNNKPVFIIKE